MSLQADAVIYSVFFYPNLYKIVFKGKGNS